MEQKYAEVLEGLDRAEALWMAALDEQRVMRAALPHLRAQGRGTILYTSSLIGRIATPFYGTYSASKWALEAIVECYRTELSGFGIESCLIEPGAMPTAFFDGLVTPSDPGREAGKTSRIGHGSTNGWPPRLTISTKCF